MYATKQTAKRREALTLIELLVVIAIILAVAALAAAFAPRVSESTNLSRSVDQMEQWLLTAKMRAKRDGLATGIRFIQVPGDLPNTFSQVQYIQQPDPLSGGSMTAAGPNGGVLVSANSGLVTFANVDFSLGGAVLAQGLVQAGDYLEVRDGGVYLIGGVSSPTTLQLSATPYAQALNITTPTTNYRILRQPRILIGEDPLNLPNNFAAVRTVIPDTIIPNNSTAANPIRWSNVAQGPSGYFEILFSPTGAVIGSNAGSGMIVISVFDTTMTPFDINRVGIVAIQPRTGFIGAYSVAPGADPFAFARIGRESGL